MIHNAQYYANQEFLEDNRNFSLVVSEDTVKVKSCDGTVSFKEQNTILYEDKILIECKDGKRISLEDYIKQNYVKQSHEQQNNVHQNKQLFKNSISISKNLKLLI